MLKTILKLGALSLTLVRFDTQDNVMQTAFSSNLVQNVNLDTFEPLQNFGLWRHSPTKMWFKSKTPVKAVFLNNFPYWYKVKRVSLYHYEIECKNLQKYFDNTDIVEVVVKRKNQ